MGQLDYETQLGVKAYYKQGTEGDIQGYRPEPNWWQSLWGTFDYAAQAEWDAWKELEGMREQVALLDLKFFCLYTCATQRTDCTNPLYEQWEQEWHHCQHEENQADPENTQDDFCESHDTCGEGLCCGKATTYDEDGFEFGYLHVCNAMDSMEWMDHLDWDTFYTFECLPFDSGIKLAASFTAIVSALYLIA